VQPRNLILFFSVREVKKKKKTSYRPFSF